MPLIWPLNLNVPIVPPDAAAAVAVGAIAASSVHDAAAAISIERRQRDRVAGVDDGARVMSDDAVVGRVDRHLVLVDGCLHEEAA